MIDGVVDVPTGRPSFRLANARAVPWPGQPRHTQAECDHPVGMSSAPSSLHSPAPTSSCNRHPSEVLHWVGVHGPRPRLRCRLCATEATRAWRRVHLWQRAWQSLVQRAKRKFQLPPEVDLSWETTGRRVTRRLLGCIPAQSAEVDCESTASSAPLCACDASARVLTWPRGCSVWQLGSLRVECRRCQRRDTRHDETTCRQ